MLTLDHCRAVVFVACLAPLAGCNTDDELAEQRLNVLKAESASLVALKKDLTAQAGGNGPVFEGPGTVSIFLSKNLINSALRGVVGVSMPFPNVDGATLTIKSVTADLKLGYPLVTIAAEATKASIGVALQVIGTARLETTIDPAGPTLMVNVRLEELLPKAQWAFFDFKVGGFVRDIIKAKVSKELSNFATVKVPIATDIPLSLPAQQMPVTLPGIVGVVNTPALSVLGHAAVSRVLVLPDGLRVYGTVTAKVGI